MIALAQRLSSITYSRYFAVSVAALTIDLGLFMLLRNLGIALPVVAMLSYGAGILAHWILSSRMVFANDLRARGSGRRRQQLMFILSALIGLLLTTLIVTAASRLIDPRLAKLIAVGVSFQVTYLLRSRIVFA